MEVASWLPGGMDALVTACAAYALLHVSHEDRHSPVLRSALSVMQTTPSSDERPSEPSRCVRVWHGKPCSRQSS